MIEENLKIENVIYLITRLQNLCEGFDETNKNAIITSKVKILLAISQSKVATPSYLKNEVRLAKSNIALLCNNLVNDGYIQKTRDKFDTREIVYSLTEKGNEYLNDFLSRAKKNFNMELAYKHNINEINTGLENIVDLVK